MSWKPESYPSVSPYLLVRDAHKALEFMESVFGAVRLRFIESEDGAGVIHAEARIHDSVVMMGEVSSIETTNVHIYVPNAKETFAKAIAAGGEVVQELRHSGDGDYRGGISDNNGTIWWISTQVE